MKTDLFGELVLGLTKSKIPSRASIREGDFYVELGWNYPDSLFHKVTKVTDKLGIEVSVCAEVHGGSATRRVTVLGGPKRW